MGRNWLSSCLCENGLEALFARKVKEGLRWDVVSGEKRARSSQAEAEAALFSGRGRPQEPARKGQPPETSPKKDGRQSCGLS